jgi:arylsulfatase A
VSLKNGSGIKPRAAYAAMISHMESDVGMLLKHLEELQLDQNTMVIFTSDNGTTHLEEEVDYKFFDSVGELRGLKGSLYEGGVRAPTIVRWPDHVKPGSSDFISGFEDWLPTLLEVAAAEVPAPDRTDTISLVPLVTTGAQSQRPFFYQEFPGYGGQQSIRMGDWKAVRQKMSQGGLRTELYHVARDVSESTDLAMRNPNLVEQMEREMVACRVPSISFPLKPLDPLSHPLRKK